MRFQNTGVGSGQITLHRWLEAVILARSVACVSIDNEPSIPPWEAEQRCSVSLKVPMVPFGLQT